MANIRKNLTPIIPFRWLVRSVTGTEVIKAQNYKTAFPNPLLAEPFCEY